MDPQDAVNQLCRHLLGEDFYCSTSAQDNYNCNKEIVDTICSRYKAVDESPKDKWRRRHKKCKFCAHCEFILNSVYKCTAKDIRDLDIEKPRPFCSVFELSRRYR